MLITWFTLLPYFLNRRSGLSLVSCFGFLVPEVAYSLILGNSLCLSGIIVLLRMKLLKKKKDIRTNRGGARYSSLEFDDFCTILYIKYSVCMYVCV